MLSCASGAARPAPRAAIPLLRWSAASLVAASWGSAAIFGTYILAFYIGAIPAGHLDHWNKSLPRLYQPGRVMASVAIGAHMAMGGVLLLAGPVQLIGAVRRRWVGMHRWIGRIYVAAAGGAGLGGLAFIATEGTVGGAPMDAGFGLYGVLMVLAAVQTYRHARARRLPAHRAWAVRLFALAIGSWLYRMDYGFWMLAADGAGSRDGFTGPFDIVMAFFFYLPNLLVAELFIRARQAPPHAAVRAAAGVVLNTATLFVVVGTYYFARYYWGPGIRIGAMGLDG